MTRAGSILCIYLVLLVASRLWILLAPPELELPEGMRVASLVEVAPDANPGPSESLARRVRLAYRSAGKPDREAVLLLHGSPGSLQDFASLAERFGPERFVIVPDMLGFGFSERRVADYSFVAQSNYLLQLLDELGIERVHVVGFSWGGGVALELAARSPERIRSIVMVSAIGVQELELLGRFELNRLVHAFQHAIVVGLDWALPHFGALSGGPLGLGYTRSFLDSDQRPMRPALEGWQGPMLIVHGRSDFLVPPNAAREHERLVPQSRAVWIDGGHLVLWSHPDEVAAALVDWLAESDAGRLPTRADASADRMAAAARSFDRMLAGPQDGIGWIVFLLLVFAASMVSEDLTCAGVGLLVATGQVGFVGGVLACVFALVLGDLVLYSGGRLLGPPLLRRLSRRVSEVDRIGSRLRQSGGLVLLLGRFVPGARLPTYLAAGVVSYPILLATFWLTLAALLWAPAIVGVTALGGRALDMQGASPATALAVGGLLVITIAIAARIGPRMLTHRGRRLLLARWRRLRRWEFWPIWALYLPLLPSILAMAIRQRSLRVVTLVNPPIEGGGLAGESKAEIGAVLDRVPAHAVQTAIIERADPASRVSAVAAFMTSQHLDYPVVLKPDVGERGRGVSIARHEADVHDYFENHPGRTLAQAYVGGLEFGIFYVRVPGAPHGEVFSLARKSPRQVEGNGRDSIERLILDDPICLPMAETLLSRNADRLDVVPATGERVRVTELGTHSLGCRFLVGEDLRTAALERAVDALSQAAELDFGRYDVRAESEDDLRRGAFKVVEFNGLTGEAAHMYDPRYGFWAGLRILREQWRRAFEVAAGHRAAGRRPLSWIALATLARNARH